MTNRERLNLERQLLQNMEREQSLVSKFLAVLALVSLGHEGPALVA
ncbi:MAG: hypothetical protein LBJ12_07240 [Oscillospiraceae bacterium]|jgi:hypothetical protein|nr:hypothetical protein [Oscillospiraceae bacterium]